MEKEDLYGKLEIKNRFMYEGKFKNNDNLFDEGEGTISYPNGIFLKRHGKIKEKMVKEPFSLMKV